MILTIIFVLSLITEIFVCSGATTSPPNPDEFASGDFVRVELDLEVFRMMQEVHGEWSSGMGQV